jgi:hypothetical protein
MACEPITIEGVSQATMTELQRKIQGFGLKLPPGNSGTISGKGVSASFNYDPAAQTLEVTVLEKPFFVTCTMIEDQLRAALK